MIKSTVAFDFWACQRPLTRTWGSGQVWGRLCKQFGTPDAAFGKTDGIPEGVDSFDLKNGYDWLSLPFADNHFEFGYWDPPYDRMYKKEGKEIWRVCRRLAILHTFIWPRAWLVGAEREAMVAVTMGPLKQIRCLQIHHKPIAQEEQMAFVEQFPFKEQNPEAYESLAPRLPPWPCQPRKEQPNPV